MNTSAIMSQFTALMAGIGTIPSHVEAGRIVYIDDIDERASLDPLIDARSADSQTQARLVRMASTFSRDEVRERSFESLKFEYSFFSEVQRLDRFLDASWILPSMGIELSVRNSLANYDESTPSNKKALYDRALALSNNRSESRAECDNAPLYFASSVLLGALGDFEDSVRFAEIGFMLAALFFGDPLYRAVAAEAGISFTDPASGLRGIPVETHYARATANWLWVVKELGSRDRLGSKIALFRGLYLAAVRPWGKSSKDLLKISADLNGMEIAFADQAEDYMRLSHAELTTNESRNVGDEGKRVANAKLFLSKAAEAWRRAGDNEKSLAAEKLVDEMKD